MSGNSTTVENLNTPYNTIVSKPYVNNKEDADKILNNQLLKKYDSGVINNADSKEGLKNKIPINSEENLDTNQLYNLVNGYLSGRIESSENRNDMITQTPTYDPLKNMVKDYLKENESMYDNRGKYFDAFLFNKKFDEYIEQKNKERLLKEKVKLYDLNKAENIKVNPYDLPLNKLLINTKTTWFDMYDNLISGRKIINSNDPEQLDSFFYIGITLIAVAILYIILTYIFN
jgi:hypothetical protein